MRYRIVAGQQQLGGLDFEVPDGATEEEIAEAAFNAVVERLSYGWEQVEDVTSTDQGDQFGPA